MNVELKSSSLKKDTEDLRAAYSSTAKTWVRILFKKKQKVKPKQYQTRKDRGKTQTGKIT